MLLLASGRGTRLGSAVPKAFVACRGVPLVVRSLRRLAQVTDQRDVVLAAHPDDHQRYIEPLRADLERASEFKLVAGGETRQESMQAALAAADDDCELVLVHDAARPFLPIEATRQTLRTAAEDGAALLAVPVADTLKRADDRLRVLATVDRARLHQAQTPQVVRRDLLLEALGHAERTGFQGTDDVSLFEHAGLSVRVVPGDRRNFKITTPEDLAMAELLAQDPDLA